MIPVGAGFIASLPRPGGNTTGFSAFDYSTGGKWVELLKEIAPIVAANTPDAMATIRAAKAEFGFRNLLDGIALGQVHRDAGFSSVSADEFQYEGKRPDGTTSLRKCMMVTSSK